MSVEWMTWAFKQNIGDAGAKFVLVVLADHADKRGYAWPSQDQIAKNTDQSESTVRRHIKTLERAGFLSREQRRRKDGRKTSDGYLLKTSAVNMTGENGATSPCNLTGETDATSPRNLNGEVEKSSAVRLTGEKPVDKCDLRKTSPVNLTALHRSNCTLHIEEPPLRTTNRTPKPPKTVSPVKPGSFRIEHHLTDLDRGRVRAAAARLDVKWLGREFDHWVAESKVQPREPVSLFLKFIARKVAEEKA